MSSKSPGLKRRQLIVRVLFLDDTVVPFQIEAKATGFVLTNLVYQYLKLVESDYFGLEFIDPKGKKCWLDHDKAVSKQVPNNSMLIFCVKFYTPDPGQLEEEYTRYLFALQIKRDLGQGVLICTDATACLLASYILQAELGDYLDSYHSTPNYFADKKFFPHQTDEHDLKILDYHKNHIGQSPAEADLNLLDIARKTELYGVIMHPAKDHEGVQLNLAVASLGILVFQNFTKINTFSWAKIRKLSFKRKKFLIKLHPENYGFYKDTVEFYFDNRDDSKNFWKKCIENHSFFRCVRTERAPRPKSRWIVPRGSSFRYYGRTQKELIETAREQQIGKHRPFDRSYHSMRSISQFASNTDGNVAQNGAGMTSAMSMNLVNGNSNGNSQSTGNGTQSLNRNLASRSTGAIQMSNGLQSNNNNSTLSSNDDSSVNLQQHSTQNAQPAHHLAYVANSQQQQASPSVHHHYNNKSATLQSAQSYAGRGGSMYHHHDDNGDYHDDSEHQMHNGADEYDNEDEEEEEDDDDDDEEVDDPLSHQDPHHLAYKQRFSAQEAKGGRRYRQAMDDTSTHGSRTIDSRYSVNKGLGLSDEDDVEHERDDDDDDDEDEEEGEPYDYDEEQHEQQMVSPPLVNDESSYGQQHSRYEQKDYGQMSNGHQVVQDNGNNSTMHRCTCGQLHPVVEQQQQVTSLNRPTSSNRNRPTASSNYQNQESNHQFDQYNQQISDSDGGISSSYSFRNPTRPKSGNLISLPIQQQQQSVQHQSNLRPSTLKKIDINTTTTSDSHSLVPINPNKIISRKEVITTYKEETKNTLLEECYQTTTFYDSTTPSTQQQQQQLLIQQPAPPPPPLSKSLLTTKEDNQQDNKYGHHLQTSQQQQQSEDLDNNDDGKKNTSVKPFTLNSSSSNSSKSRNNSSKLVTKSKSSSGSSNNNRTNNKSDGGSGGGEVGMNSKSSMTYNSSAHSSLTSPPNLSSATLPKPARPSNPPSTTLNPKSSIRRIHFSEQAELPESPPSTITSKLVSSSGDGGLDNKPATLESQKRHSNKLNKTPIYVTSTQVNQRSNQVVERVIKKKKSNLPVAKSTRTVASVQTSPPSDSNHLPALVTQCGPECEAISYSITSRSNSANSLSMVSFLHENLVTNSKKNAEKYAANNMLGPLMNSDKLDSLEDRYSFLASTSTSSESLVENPTLQSIKSMSNSSSSLSLSLHEGEENLNDGLNLEQLTKNLSRQLDKTERRICKMGDENQVVDNDKFKNSLPRMTKFVESVEIQRMSYVGSQDPDDLTPIVASTIQKHSSALSPNEPYSTRQMFNTLDFLNGTRVHTSGTSPSYNYVKETKSNSETEVARKPSLKKQTWIVEDTPERDKQPSVDKNGNKKSNKCDKKLGRGDEITESKLTTRILKLSESDENQIDRLDYAANPLLPPVAAELLLSANSPQSLSKENLVVEQAVRDNDEDSLANMGSFSNIVDAVSEMIKTSGELESNKAEESILFRNNTLEIPQDEEKIDEYYLPEPPSNLLVDEDEEDKQIQQLAASLVKDVIEKSTILTTVSTLTTITTTTTLNESEEEPDGHRDKDIGTCLA